MFAIFDKEHNLSQANRLMEHDTQIYPDKRQSTLYQQTTHYVRGIVKFPFSIFDNFVIQ